MNKILKHTIYASVAIAAMTTLTACSSDDDNDSSASDNDALPAGNPSVTDPTVSGPGMGSDPSPTINLVPDVVVQTAIGSVFTDRNDVRTLYIRTTDEPNVITCIDACAMEWPPLTTDVTDQGISGQFDVIARPDGTSQWTLGGYPLHFYSGDAASAEINGQGIASQWYVARPDPLDSGDTSVGETLVVQGSVITSSGDAAMRNDFDGRTLYFFANDTEGVSNCDESDACSTMWPPLYADIGAVGDNVRNTVITRSDDTTQWAYDNKPLYLYSGDAVTGDITGDGIGGVWSVATP